MTQGEDVPADKTTTPRPSGDNSSHAGDGGDLSLPPVDDSTSITGTIAAVTVAVLACVLILTMVMICRALRKRRRARQGDRMGDIPTISTGIMGTGVAAYSNVRVEGNITWEPVNSENHQTTSPSNHNERSASHNNRRGRRSRHSNSARS